MLALTCTIRSVNASRPTADEKPTMLHGLSFEEVTSQDTLGHLNPALPKHDQRPGIHVGKPRLNMSVINKSLICSARP